MLHVAIRAVHGCSYGCCSVCWIPGSAPVGTAPLPAELFFELPPELLGISVLSVDLDPLAGELDPLAGDLDPLVGDLDPLAGELGEATGVEWVGTVEVAGSVTTGVAGTVAAVVVTGA